MSLPIAANPRARAAIALLACASLFSGCTTSPTTGRAQFNILPGALETTVPDLRFDVKTMLASPGEYCKEDAAAPDAPCAAREQAEKLSRRIAPIAERLGAVTPELSPELVTRVPHVEVFIVPNDALSVTSSAGGKIAVGSGLARLELTDTDLALALAREFGRLASAHHRESTSAGLAVSLITSSPLVGAYAATSILADLLFPMGALFKVGISLIGSIGTEQLVELSQQGEADEFAGKLLIAAGYDLHELAEHRPEATENAAKLGWLPAYFSSRAKVAGMGPQSVTMARMASDQAHPQEARADGVAPPGETASQAAAKPELPAEPKVEVAMPAAEMPAPALDDPPPAAGAKIETDVAPAGERRLPMAAPAAAALPLAVVGEEPAAEPKGEAAKPRLQAAKLPKPQATPLKARPVAAKVAAKPKAASPRAKPAAGKAATKPPVKNRKVVRKPPPKQP